MNYESKFAFNISHQDFDTLKLFCKNLIKTSLDKIFIDHFGNAIRGDIIFKSLGDYNYFKLVFDDVFTFDEKTSTFWSKLMTKHKWGYAGYDTNIGIKIISKGSGHIKFSEM